MDKKREPNIIKRLGSEYVVLRTRITLRGFKELLVRQIKPIEMSNLIYLVDYRV